MLFRAITNCAGKFSFQTGDTVDLPQADAADLVASGALLALESPVKTESEPAAVAAASEDKPAKAKR